MTHYVADIRKARDLLGWRAAACRSTRASRARRVVPRAPGARRRLRRRLGAAGDRLQACRPSLARVLAIFGPTASGKTRGRGGAVADRLGGRGRLRRLDAGLPRPADPDGATASGRHGSSASGRLSHEGSVAEYAALAHAAIDELLAAGRTPVVAGGTGLYLRAALVDLGLPPAPPPGTSRALGGASTTASGAERAHARARRARSRSGRARPPERPPPRRARARAHRARLVAAVRQPTASGRTRCATRRTVFGLDVPRDVLLERIERRAREMFEAGVVDEARTALAGDVSTTAIHALGLREVAELPRERSTRGARSCARAATPPTSASGCGAFRALLASTPTARRTRLQMRSSKWHALGNVYLLVEQAEPLTPDRVRELTRDADGVLEVRRRAREVTVWNPDGSIAEMSGQRRAHRGRWLARESGAQRGDAPRRRSATSARRSTATLVDARRRAASTSGSPRRSTSRESASSSRRSRSATRTPSSVATRRDVRRLGPLLETAPALSRADERPARPGRRRARSHGRRVGARGGGDASRRARARSRPRPRRSQTAGARAP